MKNRLLRIVFLIGVSFLFCTSAYAQTSYYINDQLVTYEDLEKRQQWSFSCKSRQKAPSLTQGDYETNEEFRVRVRMEREKAKKVDCSKFKNSRLKIVSQGDITVDYRRDRERLYIGPAGFLGYSADKFKDIRISKWSSGSYPSCSWEIGPLSYKYFPSKSSVYSYTRYGRKEPRLTNSKLEIRKVDVIHARKIKENEQSLAWIVEGPNEGYLSMCVGRRCEGVRVRLVNMTTGEDLLGFYSFCWN